MFLVFMDFLIKLGGYVLVTTGAFMLYLIFFRKDRMPPIFSKTWFILLISTISVIGVIAGWFLVIGL